VLLRVWTEEAFAAAALDTELRRRGELDPRDAALATELVYGVLRTQHALDEQLAIFAAHRSPPDDPEVMAHLRMAIYTLAFLDRVPPFAAVSEAVAGVRAAGGERMAGFANAILRRLATEYQTRGRPSLEASIAASAPGWLRGALRRSIGRGPAAAYLTAGPVPPPIGLCLALGEDRDAWIARLQAAAPNATIEPGKVSPRALLVRGSGDVRKLPGHGTAWIIQEEGAQVVTLAAGVQQPGERVLDACSGRGNKAWLFGQQVRAPTAPWTRADLHAPKLERLRGGAARGTSSEQDLRRGLDRGHGRRARGLRSRRSWTRPARGRGRCGGDRRSGSSARRPISRASFTRPARDHAAGPRRGRRTAAG
jgi:16S rRNA (cytosine967-C5)-methyltransferase